MRKSNITKVLLTGALATSAFALAGCGASANDYRAPFEQSSIVQEAINDNNFIYDTPNSVTSYEAEITKEDGGEVCIINATIEDESFKADVQALGRKADSGDYTFIFVTDPVITPKKGIDYIDEESPLADQQGYTVEYDESAQTTTITLSDVVTEESALGKSVENGTITYEWDGESWRREKDEVVDSVVLDTNAINGTYAPDNPNAPTVTISNVAPAPSKDDSDATVYTCGISYTFAGIEESGEATISGEYLSSLGIHYLNENYDVKTENEDTAVEMLFNGDLVEGGFDNVEASATEEYKGSHGFAWLSDKVDEHLEGLKYTKQ